MIEGRPTGYSRVTLSRIMTAQDVNLYGTVHGGAIMKFVDDAAGVGVSRVPRSQRPCVVGAMMLDRPRY